MRDNYKSRVKNQRYRLKIRKIKYQSINIPTQAGIQINQDNWIPVFTGMVESGLNK